MDELVRTTLAGIPGWEEATLAELPGGLTNRTWVVENASGKAVLKIDTAVRTEPYNARPAEAGIQAIAAEKGLANRVLYADDRVLMTEFIDGDVWQPHSLAQADNIERVAQALRRLHALPLTGRTFDARIAARRYVSAIETPDTATIAYCRQVIETQRLPHNLCCCHNDLVAANIVATPELKFLDWEYACDNDPFFDLATIVEHHDLGDDLAMRLLDAYFDGDGRRWRSQLEAQRDLYSALYWLWLASRPDSSAASVDEAEGRLRRRSPVVAELP